MIVVQPDAPVVDQRGGLEPDPPWHATNPPRETLDYNALNDDRARKIRESGSYPCCGRAWVRRSRSDRLEHAKRHVDRFRRDGDLDSAHERANLRSDFTRDSQAFFCSATVRVRPPHPV